MMRIHRIRIANVAGVSSREVTLADQGITLIAGQNESGKSTLFLALQALLDHPDDASHREVKALKPLHTGLTPQVEADITIGPYRLTYSKSFAKGKAGGTILRIDQPVAESLTGREAHDRVAQIIDQNLDRALWDAMRITQGNALGLPTLAGVRSLSSALDQAVGNDIAGEREDNLLNRANEEFLRYWTAGGKPNKEGLDLEQKAADAKQSETAVRAKLQELEGDITAYKGKTRELATTNGQTAGLTAARDKAASDKARVGGLLAEVQIKDLAVTAATQAVQMAQSAHARRVALIADLDVAQESLSLAARDRTQAQERPAELAYLVTELEADSKAARTALDGATSVSASADRDVVYEQNRMDLMLLAARMEAIVQADSDAAEAESVEKSTRATKADVAALSQASTAMAVAKAKLGSASPKVSIKALSDVRVRLNGSDTRLTGGQELTAPSGNSTQLTIGDVAEISVEGANDVTLLERELESATLDHHAILDRLAVKTIEEADEQRQRRERAADKGTAARRAATEHLIDLTREALRGKILHLTDATAGYLASRPANASPRPDGLPSAKEAADNARVVFNQARQALEAVERNAKSTTAAAATAQTAAAVCDANWASRTQTRDQVTKSLVTAREERTDNDLETALETSQQAATTVVADRDSAKAAYDKADPILVASGLVAAEKARANHEANLRRIHDDVSRLKARLELNGEAGLEEGLQRAQRDAFVALGAVARFRRRALAAKLLYETLQICRDEAQKSYVAPLKGEIERLGKRIFGEEFQVLINEDLSVEARVMNGTTIPYANLSSGAKEQIGILERLATARIVGKGGVPLVLDDAVAYTDNVRQEALAAALGFASVDTQTIVVTCAPEKYAHAPIETRIDF